MRHVVMGMLLMLLMVLGNLGTHAANDRNIDVEVEFGYNNVFRYGDYLPLTIHITNGSDAFDGEVIIRYHVSYDKDAILKQRVSLEKDGQKDVEFTMNSVSQDLDMLRIILMEDGKEVYNQTIKLPFLQGVFKDKTIMGILSDDRDAISYIQPPGEFVKIPLDHQNFPDNIFGIHMFDTLVVNNYDLSQLQKNQLDTLKKWVGSGGQLILGTGARYTKTLSTLEDFLPMIRVTDTREVPVHTLNTVIGQPIEETADSGIPLTVANFDGDKLATYTTTQVELENLVYHIPKGNGMVRLFAFDLGMAPMDTYRYKQEVLKHFIVGAVDQYNKYYEPYRYQLHNRVNPFLWGIPDIKLPTLSSIITIIIIYVLLINPILYLILKRKKKRQYMWIVVPCLAVAFVVVMFVTGMNTRIKAPVSQVVNMILFNTSGGSKASYGTVINTNKSNLTVASIDGLEMIPIIDTSHYYHNPDNAIKVYEDFQVAYEKTMGTQPNIQFKKTRVFGNYNFEIDPSKELPESNKIDTQLIYDGNRLNGTVTNQYDFDLNDCLVTFKSLFYEIDHLGAGETIDLTNRTPIGPYDSINSYFWERKWQLDSHQEQQIMDQQQSIKNALVRYSNINESQLVMLAWTNHSFYQGFTVANKQVKKYEKTLICVNEPVVYQSGIQYVLNFGELRGKVNGKYVDDHYYSHAKVYDLVFQLPMDAVDVKTIKIRPIIGRYQAEIRLKNGDMLSDNIGEIITLTGDGLDQYLTDDGEIILNITLESDMNDIEIPEIYVEGIGK